MLLAKEKNVYIYDAERSSIINNIEMNRESKSVCTANSVCLISGGKHKCCHVEINYPSDYDNSHTMFVKCVALSPPQYKYSSVNLRYRRESEYMCASCGGAE